MTEWREVVLSDLCKRVTVGHVGKMATEYVDDGVFFLRSQNVKPFSIIREGMLQINERFHQQLAKSALRAGDVVVVRTGYPGTAAVVPPELDGSNCADLVVITPSDQLNPHVLAAIFNSAWGRSTVGGQLVGSAQQHFNVGSAKALRLRLPSKRTQDKIATILCAIGDLIENNRRQIEIVEQMAVTIYQEWFICFRYPGQEDVTLVDSPLGPIPEAWSVRPLVSVANLTMGQSPKSEHYNSERIGRPFHQGVSDFGKHFPTDRKYCSVEGRTARDGDILISVRAPVGRLNIASGDVTIGRGLASARSNKGQQSLLFRALKGLAFAEEDSMGGGTIFKAIGKAELEQVRMLCAPADIEEHAEAVFRDNMGLIRSTTLANRRLTELRDHLLPKLVTGQIDVSKLDLDVLAESVA